MKINNELFRLIRVSKRLTQRDFAELVGISHGMVSHIETNLKPVSNRVNDLIVRNLNLSEKEIRKYNELLALSKTL